MTIKADRRAEPGSPKFNPVGSAAGSGDPPSLAPDAYSQALASILDPGELAEFVIRERGQLIAAILHPGCSIVTQHLPGTRTACRFSDLIDAVLRRMFVLACETAGAAPSTLPMAIVATGGYGRRELAPYSDIDLTFVPLRDAERSTDSVVRELFKLVMDVFIARCGLEVGYAYRLLTDCAELDHQTASGLLDARQIAGSERVFIKFEDAFWNGFNATDFIFTKIDERAEVLRKRGSLPRVVEPNLKEGAGGLRDIHTAVWLVQAHEHLAAARMRGNRGLSVVCRELKLSDHEHAAITNAKERLFAVRNALHAVCGAERDELVVTRQEDVAQALGYVSDVASGRPAVEQFMSDLFPALATSRRLAEMAIDSVGNSKLMLGIGLDCERKRIVAANNALGADDPAWLVWACELAQRYSLSLSDGVKAAAVRLLEAHATTEQPAQVASAFTQVVVRVGSTYPVLQTMADLGILGWILPEFKGLMDLIPYDASHDYTIGQHSLLAIKYIDDLLLNAVDEEDAEMRRALQELPHPEYLMLAALLHDTGKAVPDQPHAMLSAGIAEAVCRRLDWSEEATATVCFLVRHHQLMGETARLQDLTMDKTIRDFVAVVDDADRLNMLYLLTYADIRAVADGTWTPVKRRFLRDLWQRATAAIYDQEPASTMISDVADTRRKIKRDLTLEKFDSIEIEEHIEAMPPYYLFNSSLNEVAMHLGFVRRVRSGEVVLDFHDERAANFTEVTICTMDDPAPGLLSKIAAALLASSLTVHSARVVTRTTERDSIALDTVLADYRGKPLTAGKRQEVSAHLISVLSGEATAGELIAKKSKSAVLRPASAAWRAKSHYPNRDVEVARVSHDFDDNISIIELSGPVALDLFYRICSAVSDAKLDIRSAKLSASRVDTQASLYVSGARQLSEAEVKRSITRYLGTDNTPASHAPAGG